MQSQKSGTDRVSATLRFQVTESLHRCEITLLIRNRRIVVDAAWDDGASSDAERKELEAALEALFWGIWAATAVSLVSEDDEGRAIQVEKVVKRVNEQMESDYEADFERLRKPNDAPF